MSRVAFRDLLGEPVRNGVYKPKEFHGSGVKLVNMKELFAFDFLSNQPDARIELTPAEFAKSQLRDGDLLFARRSFVLEGAGKCSLVVNPPESLTFESSMIRARPNPDKADSRFLYYYFRSPDGRARMASIAARTAVSGITGSNLAALEIDVPGVDAQREIAEILSLFDELIENNRRRGQVLEDMARAIYQEWFVKFRYPGHEAVPIVDSALGPIPEGWQVQTASHAIQINPTIKVVRSAEHPFIAMGDVSETSMVCYPSETRTGGTGARFVNGDTLLARISPSLQNGKTGFVQSLEDGVVGHGSTEFIVMRGRTVGRAFTYCLARQDEFRSNAIASMVGASGRQRVRNECFDTYYLAVPPATLNESFEAVAAPMFAEVDLLRRQAISLRAARDLLLPKLVTGQIGVSGLKLDRVLEGAVA